MSEFLSPFIIEWHSHKKWRLAAQLRYQSDLLNRIIEVPEGFLTDLASVPRAPFAYWMAGGRGPRAATVHDYLYSYPETLRDILTRLLADAVFQEALPVDNVPNDVVHAMWMAVRDYGAPNWHGPADPMPTINRSGEVVEAP